MNAPKFVIWESEALEHLFANYVTCDREIVRGARAGERCNSKLRVKNLSKGHKGASKCYELSCSNPNHGIVDVIYTSSRTYDSARDGLKWLCSDCAPTETGEGAPADVNEADSAEETAFGTRKRRPPKRKRGRGGTRKKPKTEENMEGPRAKNAKKESSKGGCVYCVEDGVVVGTCDQCRPLASVQKLLDPAATEEPRGEFTDATVLVQLIEDEE